MLSRGNCANTGVVCRNKLDPQHDGKIEYGRMRLVTSEDMIGASTNKVNGPLDRISWATTSSAERPDA